jgi:hypothetical protein
MKKRLVDLGSQIAILDIASYGRGSARSFTPPNERRSPAPSLERPKSW